MSMPLDDDQIEIIQEFATESRDMIEQLEPAIIELGQNSDSETMNAIFRLFHSMKGSAGFLEFDHMTRVAHAAENLLDLIRNGEIDLVPNHVTLLCAACDFAKEALDMVESDFNDDAMVAPADDISERLHQAIELAQGKGEAETVADEAPTATPTEQPAPEADFPQMEITDEMRLSFVQEGNELLQNMEQGLLSWGENQEDKEFVGEIFRNIHSFKGNCGFFGFSQIEKLSHQMENILDRVKSGSKLAVENPADQLLASLDVLQRAVNNISDGKEDTVENLEQHLSDLQLLIAPLLGDFLV
ncbi:MAG: Hpt domain-containing protein, partial [Deltaproteobacteria bacterium]|nr:Hpt domain-containing protein [Deltaproteobacteria bacterium]